MNFKPLKNSLEEFSKKHDLINQAKKTCIISIKNGLKDNPDEGYPLEEVALRFDKQEFVFNHHFFKTPYIKTQIGLYQIKEGTSAKDDSNKYGYYFLATDENGVHFDDSLVYE